MKSSALCFSAVMLACTSCSATPLIREAVFSLVPAIPHGQDWGIVLPPNVVLPRNFLPPEEVLHILPAMPTIVHDPQIRELRTIMHNDPMPQSGTLVGIVAAIVFLLAGYELIPRVHAQTLRIRSIHLKQDLFN